MPTDGARRSRRTRRARRRRRPARVPDRDRLGGRRLRRSTGREPLVVNHHNLTPLRYFAGWEPVAAHGVVWGRAAAAPAAPTRPRSGSPISQLQRARADRGRLRAHDRRADPARRRGSRRASTPRRATGSRATARAPTGCSSAASPRTRRQHDVVKAFAAYRRFHDPDARLHLVGGAPRDVVRATRCAAVRGRARARRRGRRSPAPCRRGELAAYYAAADVFVVPAASTRASACRCSRRCTTGAGRRVRGGRRARDARRRRAAARRPRTRAPSPRPSQRVVGDAGLRAGSWSPPARGAAATSTSRAPGPRSSSRAGGGAGVKVAVVTPRYGARGRRAAPRSAARMLAERLAAARLGGRGAHDLRPRRRRRGPTTTRPAPTTSTACPCTASRSGAGPPTSTCATELVVAPRPTVTGRRSSRVDRQAGAGHARRWSTPSRTATPTSSRSTRTSTTRPSPGCPRVGRPRGAAPGRPRRAAARLPLFRAVFAAAAGLVYWSEPERRLVERLFAVGAKPAVVLGLGVDAGAGDADAAARRASASATGRTCCAWAGSTTARARACSPCFAAYKARRPGRCALVFAGPVVHQPPRAPRHRRRRRGRRGREVGPAARRARVRRRRRVRVVLDRR